MIQELIDNGKFICRVGTYLNIHLVNDHHAYVEYLAKYQRNCQIFRVIALIYVVTDLAHNSSPKAAVHKLVMQQEMQLFIRQNANRKIPSRYLC